MTTGDLESTWRWKVQQRFVDACDLRRYGCQRTVLVPCGRSNDVPCARKRDLLVVLAELHHSLAGGGLGGALVGAFGEEEAGVVQERPHEVGRPA